MITTATQVDVRCFPAMAAYLARLPDGLASYPDCHTKAVFLRSALEDYPLRSLADRLPPVLADLVRSPPPSNAWLRQVYLRCILRVILDQYFQGDEAAMVAWSYGMQKKLLGGPVYRVMFALLSQERLMYTARQLWGHFHRGVTMEVVTQPHQIESTLRYPAHIFYRLDLELLLIGFRAIIELAGGRDVRVEILETSPTQGRSRITWR